MIERALSGVSGLFVERVASVAVAPTLVPMSELLVVDGCGSDHRFAELLAALTRSQPICVRELRVDDLGELGEEFRCDRLWLLVDADSDIGYCELLASDLAANCPRGPELVALGAVEVQRAAARFEPAQVGRAPFWRRRRALASGVERARELLAAGAGAE